MLGDIRLRLSDTAGLRSTDDPIEKFGIERARNRVKNAELVLAVFDGSRELTKEDEELLNICEGHQAVAVINKNDLETRIDCLAIEKRLGKVISISALDPKSIRSLESAVKELFDVANFDPSAAMLSNERQLVCAQKACERLSECISAIGSGITLDAVSVCLDDCLSAIMELTGERVTDSVADAVFHQFCVGK